MLESRGGAKNSQYVEGSGKQTGETVEQGGERERIGCQARFEAILQQRKGVGVHRFDAN